MVDAGDRAERAPFVAEPAGGPRAVRRAAAARRSDPALGKHAVGAVPVPVSARPEAVAPQRKVHYQGYAKIMATKPAELVDRATALVKQAGGYVERLVGTQLTVRVPVDRFREVFEQLLELGEVVQRQISARDITDA